jgi:hypothetical protein
VNGDVAETVMSPFAVAERLLRFQPEGALLLSMSRGDAFASKNAANPGDREPNQ